MKIKIYKILIITISLFLSLIMPSLSMASNETISIVDNTGFPQKINIKGYCRSEWNGNGTTWHWDSSIKYNVDFKDYLYGVVFVEMAQTTHNGKEGRQYPPCLKAQAIAAMNKALKKMYDSSGAKEIIGTTAVQGYKESERDKNSNLLPYYNEIISAVNDVFKQTTNTGKVMEYDGSVFETFYFSADTTFTRNSEEFGWSYLVQQRESISGPNVSGSLPSNLHCIGMNQFGAIEMADADSNLGYADILKHFYHPSPPIVKYVKIMQSGKKVYEAGWSVINIDLVNFKVKREMNIPAKNSDTNFTANASSDLNIEIHFSERVLSANNAIVVKIGNQTASQLSNPEPMSPPEKWTGKLTVSQLQQIPSGNVSLNIDAFHEFADTWKLDSQPDSASLNGSADYQAGTDNQHNKNIDRIPFSTVLIS